MQLSLLQWLNVILCLALGFAVSVGVIHAILAWTKNRAHTARNDFHHGKAAPIPRFGGVALIAAFGSVAAMVYGCDELTPEARQNLIIITITSGFMFILGFWDDLHPLNAKVKLLGQISIAALACGYGLRIEEFKDPLTGTLINLGPFSYVITIGWLVFLTNLINLADGIDGLAGGICLMLMFLLANLGIGDTNMGINALLAIGAAGGLFGFLKYNYPPARIYMGDGGAYFLGFLIGLLAIVSSNKGTIIAALIAPTFALALPIVDVGLAIMRRSFRGLPIFRPDRKHIHHHLVTLGISRERTVLNLYAISILCLALGFCVFYSQGRLIPICAGLLFILLIGAGYVSGFTKDWFKVGSLIGQWYALRKDSKYCRSLNAWLLMEIEYANASADEIWQEYRVIAKRLRLCKIVITLPDGHTRTWQAPTNLPGPSDRLWAIHEMGNGSSIQLEAHRDALMTARPGKTEGQCIAEAEKRFDLLGDLAAETWFAVITRWCVVNHKPFTLS